MKKKILSVKKVKLDLNKSNPPQLIINASGETSSLGWSMGQLIPYVYINPPVDGIYDFDFIAEAPLDLLAV